MGLIGRRLLATFNRLDDWMWRVPEKVTAQSTDPVSDPVWILRTRKVYRAMAERVFGYAIIWLFGFGRVRPLMKSGQVNVYGIERYYAAMAQGKGVMLIPNHGTLVEPVLLDGIFWRKMLFNRSYFPFQTPDDRLFPAQLKNLFYRYGQCIPVIRERMNSDMNKVAGRRMIQVLQAGYCLIVFGEGGRTRKYTERNQNLLKGELLPNGRRRQISEIKRFVGNTAGESGCLVMTVYIDLPDEWSWLSIEDALRLLRNGDMSGVSIYFGPEAFSVPWSENYQEQKVIMKEVSDKVQEHLLFPSKFDSYAE